MTETPVDIQYQSILRMSERLEADGEISLTVSATDWLRKVLLLSAASYFEHRVVEVVLGFVSERSRSDEAITAMIKTKVVDRKYHTFFNWEGKNANSFFSMFGSTLADQLKAQAKSDQLIDDSVIAFLELGHLRNQLVHENFATFPIPKTIGEIYLLYQTASRFLDFVETSLQP